MKRIKLVIVGLLLVSELVAVAQSDSLMFDNNEYLIGEIKSLQRGVLTFKTSYSDSNFKIEWQAVRAISSTQDYLITLTNGRRLKGIINSTDSAEVIIETSEVFYHVKMIEIVELKPIEDSFWDRFSASIDLGYNLTKANNLVQFNSRLYAGYLTEKWEVNGTFNDVFNSQDSIADTRRVDANIQFKYFFGKDWFIQISNDFLKNDEQKLDLRSTTRIGIGNYLVNTNTLYLAVMTGAAINNETYIENANPNRQSGEAFLSLEYNMFNTGDLGLLTSVITYPSLTEQGRVRVDYKFDIKYDLPLDFYVKIGTTVNYDNRPIEGASELDYVIQTGIGWEW